MFSRTAFGAWKKTPTETNKAHRHSPVGFQVRDLSRVAANELRYTFFRMSFWFRMKYASIDAPAAAVSTRLRGPPSA